MKALKSILINVATFVAFVLFGVVLCSSFDNVAAAEQVDGMLVESDELFEQTMNEVAQPLEKNIIVNKRLIYDLELRPLGFSYEFEYDGTNGYAIIIGTESGVMVTELSLSAASPYVDCQGKPVYIREFCYWTEDSGVYHALNGSDIIVSAKMLSEIYKTRYGAVGDDLQEGSRTINYISKNENEKSLAMTIPAYIYDKKPSACGPTAAANIIAYYDRNNTNLIPNYNPGSGIGPFYRYSAQNSIIDGVVEQLYEDMETNSSGIGVTLNQFKDGFTKYCLRAGYNVQFESNMTGAQLDFDEAKSVLDEQIPLLLFVSGLEIVDIQEGSGVDSYSTLYGSIQHVLAAFGYKEITYTLQGGQIEQHEFLLVATGIHRMPTAYLNINNMLQTYEALSVNIGE